MSGSLRPSAAFPYGFFFLSNSSRQLEDIRIREWLRGDRKPFVVQPQGPLSGYRFLIIEDEIMQAWQLSATLVDLGGTVTRIAYGHEQARDALEQTTFDCAIVDLNLAGTYAYQIAEALEKRGVPFVLCTAYADAMDVFRGLSEVPRLAKPVDRTDLLNAILRVPNPASH
jgi:CheY-like chemotaxis protein